MIAALAVSVAVLISGAGAASAARLYVTVGDSVGAGMGATAGQSFFDLYCAYLKSTAGGARVDQCVNESVGGLTTSSALSSGAIGKAVSDIRGSTDTPVVTVVLGGNDLLGGSSCAPITGPGCPFFANMRSVLNQLETALASHPGPHVIQWLEYYNPNHDNPFGSTSQDGATAGLLLGSNLAYSDCSATALGPIGLNDAINCIAREKGATPVDAYAPFQASCTAGDCFSDALHPNDKGYGLIFTALRDTPAAPVPATPPPDRTWPWPPNPLSISPPMVVGTPTSGSAVSCSPGSWSSASPLTFSYQWRLDAASVAGQDHATYVVAPSDTGHALSCVVAATNATGSAARASAPVTVIPGLQMVYLRMRRRVFAVGSGRRRGTGFSLALTQPAAVTITLQRLIRGRRIGAHCLPATRIRRHRPACTRLHRVGSLHAGSIHGGPLSIPFSGRVGRHTLAPGRYLAEVTAANSSGRAPVRTLGFRVVAG